MQFTKTDILFWFGYSYNFNLRKHLLYSRCVLTELKKLLAFILKIPVQFLLSGSANWTHRLADIEKLQPIMGRLARDYLYRVRGFSYEFSENGELELIERLTSKFCTLVFFDVGANKGEFTSEILKRMDRFAQGHLFDLDNELIKELNVNFPGENIVINNFGLSNADESITYFRFPEFPAVNSILEIDFGHLESEKTRAEVRAGDSYFSECGVQRVNFLKIDVEGYERFVLEGFSKTLDARKIDALSWEYGYSTAETHWTTRDFFKFLEEKGYLCGVIRKKGVVFLPWSYELNDYTYGPNFFACLPEFRSTFEAV